MDYITLDSLDTYLGDEKARLVAAELTPEPLAAVVAEVNDEVGGYVGPRMLTHVPPALTHHACAIARSRVWRDKATEKVQADHDIAVNPSSPETTMTTFCTCCGRDIQSPKMLRFDTRIDSFHSMKIPAELAGRLAPFGSRCATRISAEAKEALYAYLLTAPRDARSPVVERLEWATDVQIARSGAERRTQLRPYPRHTISFDVLLGTPLAREALPANREGALFVVQRRADRPRRPHPAHRASPKGPGRLRRPLFTST